MLLTAALSGVTSCALQPEEGDPDYYRIIDVELSGIVTDANENPIPNLRVNLLNNHNFQVTNQAGQFLIAERNVKVGMVDNQDLGVFLVFTDTDGPANMGSFSVKMLPVKIPVIIEETAIIRGIKVIMEENDI